MLLWCIFKYLIQKINQCAISVKKWGGRVSHFKVVLPLFNLGQSLTSLVPQSVENLPAVQETRARSLAGSGRFPWWRKWQAIPEFLPGKPHGHRSQAGYSPWSHKGVRNNLEAKQQIDHIFICTIIMQWRVKKPESNYLI